MAPDYPNENRFVLPLIGDHSTSGREWGFTNELRFLYHFFLSSFLHVALLPLHAFKTWEHSISSAAIVFHSELFAFWEIYRRDALIISSNIKTNELMLVTDMMWPLTCSNEEGHWVSYGTGMSQYIEKHQIGNRCNLCVTEVLANEFDKQTNAHYCRARGNARLDVCNRIRPFQGPSLQMCGAIYLITLRRYSNCRRVLLSQKACHVFFVSKRISCGVENPWHASRNPK